MMTPIETAVFPKYFHRKIHCLEDPASKVDEYRFDVGWPHTDEQVMRRCYPAKDY